MERGMIMLCDKMTDGDLLAEVDRLPYRLRFVWDYDPDVSDEERNEYPKAQWLLLELQKQCSCGAWELADCIGGIGVEADDAFDLGEVTIESALQGVKYPDDSQYFQMGCCREMLSEFLAKVRDNNA